MFSRVSRFWLVYSIIVCILETRISLHLSIYHLFSRRENLIIVIIIIVENKPAVGACEVYRMRFGKSINKDTDGFGAIVIPSVHYQQLLKTNNLYSQPFANLPLRNAPQDRRRVWICPPITELED